MFIVKKKIVNKEYFYLRESKREGKKVKAITLAYLGKNKKEAESKFKEILKSKSPFVSPQTEVPDLLETSGYSKYPRTKVRGLSSTLTSQSKEKDLKTKNPNIKKMENNLKNEIKPKESIEEEKEFFSFINEAGLIWGPSPEIYGGLAGFYTYGPLGKLLKNKIENSVRKIFTLYEFKEIEGPTIMPDIVWKASGHLDTFKDKTLKCKKCSSAFRADKLIEETHKISADSFSNSQILEFIKNKKIKCPNCKNDFENKIEEQSLMVKTKIASHDASLRPETATVTYLPFLRLYNYARKKLPFGVFQIGKAYRNEISPRQHILRMREFTQAEAQIFLSPEQKNSWQYFAQIKKEKLPLWSHKDQEKNSPLKEENSSQKLQKEITLEQAIKNSIIKTQAYAWCLFIAYLQFVNFGIPKERIRIRQHHPNEMAFYAEDAWDIEIKLNNYGWTEMCGIHDRSDYDLKQHSKFSNTKLEAQKENSSEKFTPHILEIAFGIDRPLYALIDLFYSKKTEKEGKTSFELPYHMAPIDISVFPLMKKPELTKLAKDIQEILEQDFVVEYDDSGSIGRRYLRSSTQGTPFAITIDYDSLKNNDATIRHRDTEKQIRVPIENLSNTLKKLISDEIQFEKAGRLFKN